MEPFGRGVAMSADGLSGVWRDRLRRCETRESTVAEFCEHERVGLSTYYYWKRKLEDAGESVSAPLFVAARWKAPGASGGRNDNGGPNAEGTDWSMGDSIRVDLPNGAVIRIGGEADSETIRAAVESAGRIAGSTEEAGC